MESTPARNIQLNFGVFNDECTDDSDFANLSLRRLDLAALLLEDADNSRAELAADLIADAKAFLRSEPSDTDLPKASAEIVLRQLDLIEELTQIKSGSLTSMFDVSEAFWEMFWAMKGSLKAQFAESAQTVDRASGQPVAD